MPSVAEICERKAFPKPSPVDAPRTNPAISTMDKYDATQDFGLKIWQRLSKRESGTATLALLGSIVQKGQFSEGTHSLDIRLNVIDFPGYK